MGFTAGTCYESVNATPPLTGRRFAYPEVTVARHNLDSRVTVPTIRQAMPHISRQLIRWWVTAGHLKPVGRRGRLHVYRWGDVVQVERDTRLSPQSRRELPEPVAA